MFHGARRAVLRRGVWLAVAAGLCAVTLGSPGMAQRPIPSSLGELALVQLDPHLGIAIVQTGSGEQRAFRVGDPMPDRAFRLTRLYSNRMEVEATQPEGGVAQSYWVTLAGPGAPSRAERIESRPLDVAPVHKTWSFPSAP